MENLVLGQSCLFVDCNPFLYFYWVYLLRYDLVILKSQILSKNYKIYWFLFDKMPKTQADNSLIMKMRTWLVYGRRHPTEAAPEPEVICTKVYGPNEVFAKSQFW